MQRPVVVVSSIFGGAALLSLVIWGASRARHDPARCAAGFVASGPRCCPLGQRYEGGVCVGPVAACPAGMRISSTRAACIASGAHARIAGGTLVISPSDWEVQGQVEARTVRVAGLDLDVNEVTVERYAVCSEHGLCAKASSSEAGKPVTDVSAREAELFCSFVGGRLPSGDEWLFAAAGSAGRRYPWGQTGLVCRRAAFGLVNGPCAEGATGPELAGARPDGASPDGVLDLSGNVAEWTREADGTYRTRGGSFRSAIAGELKSLSARALAADARAPDVGFRCAYDVEAK